jgi:RNA-directed DNA polymerase
MLERAKTVTTNGEYTAVEYARFADDLVVLVDAVTSHTDFGARFRPIRG